MDTLHDLGGREGFGAVRWQKDKDAIAFHEEWQARAWAICMCTFAHWRGKPEIWTLDWFRHVRERIDPVDYLTRNYYDQWTQSLAATLIDNGTIRLDELLPDAKLATNDVPTASTTHERTASVTPDRTVNESTASTPKFEAGQTVRCKAVVPAFHTRLPAYVRGKVGVVDGHHGKEPLADLSAVGVIEPEHLYTVRFDAAALWPEAQGRRERIYVDAWESYLEPAE